MTAETMPRRYGSTLQRTPPSRAFSACCPRRLLTLDRPGLSRSRHCPFDSAGLAFSGAAMAPRALKGETVSNGMSIEEQHTWRNVCSCQQEEIVMRLLLLLLVILSAETSLSLAQGRMGTPQEQQACTRDAQRFCRPQLGNDGAVQQCLQQHRNRLSKSCQKVFASHGM